LIKGREGVRKTIIIGAGPAGLAAADRLCDYKDSPIILEKDSCVGGISRTIKRNGCCFDIGGHRFFTKNKLVFDWWQDILRDDFVKTPRSSRIYYKGKFFNYPISITNVLFSLGVFNSVPICLSYLKSRFFPLKKEESLEQWFTNRFGRKLYQVFFKEYSEKIWGIPCDQISSEWAAQRIRGLSLTSALKNALFKGRKNSVKTLIKQFYYPRLGCGMMYEAAADRIIKKGGVIKLNSEVIEVRYDHNRITGLVYKDKQSGDCLQVEGNDFISSMPLDLLVSRMYPSPNEEVLNMCRRLKYRSLLMVYFVFGVGQLFKDNWIYVQSQDVKMSRIQNYKNWSSDMVSEQRKTTLGMEYFCNEDDLLWSKTDEEICALAADELEKLKLASKKDILEGFVLRVPHAYPVYEKNYYQALDAIKVFLGRFTNLQCVGRAGMFRYNGMDHSILTGFQAAENIFGIKQSLWEINADQSYLEEIDANSVS
jgi:protoporphyrinogen oxidase